MRVMQYYLFKSFLLPPFPCSTIHPLAACNKAKELTQTQTASICLIILCVIILSLLLIQSSPIAPPSVFGHRQALSLLQQWNKPCFIVCVCMCLLSLSLTLFKFLLEGGNLQLKLLQTLNWGDQILYSYSSLYLLMLRD